MPWLFVILGLAAFISALYGLIAALRSRRQCFMEVLELGFLAVAWIMHHTTIAGWIALAVAIGLEAFRRLWTPRASSEYVAATIPPAEVPVPTIEAPPGPPPMAVQPEARPAEPPPAPAAAMPLPAPEPPKPRVPPLVSIALLRSIWQPAPDVFLASLRRAGERGATLANSTSGPIRLTVKDLTLELEYTGRPLPRAQINQAAAQSWEWPEAATTAGPHAAHVIFTTRAEGAATRAASLRLHCRAQQALAEFAPVIAVLWPAAGRMIPVAALSKLMAKADDFDLAKATCLNFRIFPLEGSETGRFLCDTVGFSVFGIADLEVECEGRPSAALTDAIYRRARDMFEAVDDLNPDGARFEQVGTRWTIERGQSRFDPARDVARWLPSLV